MANIYDWMLRGASEKRRSRQLFSVDSLVDNDESDLTVTDYCPATN
jgi:hypothetical protein